MLDLIDEERAALIRYLRDGIEHERFPLSPRLVPIRAILAKLEPPPAPLPPAEREAMYRRRGSARTMPKSCTNSLWQRRNRRHCWPVNV